MRLPRPSRVRTCMVRFALVVLVACGTTRPARPDGAEGHGDATGSNDAAPAHDAASHDAATDAALVDAFPSVLDVHIQCRNDCTLVATPASIGVIAGTEFQVNWINTGDTECDVAKIDPFNQVPIVLGLEPGTSYHDAVHEWCGTLFTGMFQFRIDICTQPSYIPVNCGA